jgi:hypothetical protein
MDHKMEKLADYARSNEYECGPQLAQLRQNCWRI